MSIIHIVTLYSNAGADPGSSQAKLPIYRMTIESADHGEVIARSCVTALRRHHAGLDFPMMCVPLPL